MLKIAPYPGGLPSGIQTILGDYLSPPHMGKIHDFTLGNPYAELSGMGYLEPGVHMLDEPHFTWTDSIKEALRKSVRDPEPLWESFSPETQVPLLDKDFTAHTRYVSKGFRASVFQDPLLDNVLPLYALLSILLCAKANELIRYPVFSTACENIVPTRIGGKLVILTIWNCSKDSKNQCADGRWLISADEYRDTAVVSPMKLLVLCGS